LDDKAWLVDQIAGADVAGTPVVTIIAGACQLRKDLAADGTEGTSKELGRLVAFIVLRKDRLKVHLNLHALVYENTECGPILGSFEAAFEKRQKGKAKPIVIVPKDAPQPDPDLIALIADARRWASELLDGSAPSISTIETREGPRSGSVSRILPLAWLARTSRRPFLTGTSLPSSPQKLCEHFLSCLWIGKISVEFWASRINKASHLVQDLTPNRPAETSDISWSKSPRSETNREVSGPPYSSNPRIRLHYLTPVFRLQFFEY
jgi:hypothetical protein